MIDPTRPRLNLACFGVSKRDPGWIYVLEHRGRLKIGKTKKPQKRLRDARTWMPELHIVGVKPFWNHSELERDLHTGLAQFWHCQEWFDFNGDEFEEVFKEGFREFYDDDIDLNSVDFIYWFNSSGMAEFTLEHSRQGGSLKGFQRGEAYRK
jgi:hypothetical protein